MPRAELADLIQQLNEQMLGAARELQFEVAARLRDEIRELKQELRGMDLAGVGRSSEPEPDSADEVGRRRRKAASGARR
jgi:hypothetical protein